MNWLIAQNREEWNEWFLSHGQGEFLQSWEWGEFQKMAGREVKRWQGKENGEIKVQIQTVSHILFLNINYVYIPRIDVEEKYWNDILNLLSTEGYVFARIEPVKDFETSSDFSVYLIRPRQPGHTLIIDLHKNEVELLEEMHAKTRYNIHLSERKGVVVKEEKNIDVFWELHQETMTRDKIRGHEKKYYAGMIDMDFCRQFTAYYNDEPIASNIFIGFGDTFTYLHGASGNRERNVMAPYLLQWRAILSAKELGYKNYDFWGIAPPLESKDLAIGQSTSFHNYSWSVNHPWTGVTRFKAGFGGVLKSYGSAIDVVFKPAFYRTYLLGQKARSGLGFMDKLQRRK